MENNPQNQVTPKNNPVQQIPSPSPKSNTTPKHQSDVPISNIKQVTVHQENYPPSVQLIDQKQSTPTNQSQSQSKPPLSTTSQSQQQKQQQQSQVATPKHQKSTTNSIQRQNSSDQASNGTITIAALQQQITNLEQKIKYYESEHNDHQNQLLSQRAQYEDENKKLKKELEEKSSQQRQDSNVNKLANEYSESLLAQAHIQNLKEQLEKVQKQNAEYQEQVTNLQNEIKLVKDQYESIIQPVLQPQKIKTPKPDCTVHLIHQDLSIFRPTTSQKDKDSAIQKLQKKMSELETYLQEKDKILLEQETQLSELNDQYHDLLKQEDSLKSQLHQKQSQLEEVQKQLQFNNDSWELKIEDMRHQLNAKDGSLQDAFNLTSEKEIEIQRLMREVRQFQESINEYSNRNATLEEESQHYQQRFQEFSDENEQIKQDFEAILNYKNELEQLIEEQTQNIEQKNKRLLMLEETLRFKESDLEKKESLLRRMSQGADETKKKLTQAEIKLRQITQTTLRDMKVKMKDKLNEIEVLKEMVKSANKQAKAKDIDIQRLSKRIQRLEKMTELGKGIIQDGGMNMAIDGNNPIMEDDNELLEDQPVNTFLTPQKFINQIPSAANFNQRNKNHDPLGLNPINYTNLNGGRSVEEEVQMELLAAQQQRQFHIKNANGQMGQNNSHHAINQNSLILKAGQNYRNSKQKEIEEALELDKMLEQERRNQSHDVFTKKYDQKLENYYNNLANAHQSNMKNHSTGVKGIFGGGGDDDSNMGQRNNNDSLRYYEGMLPNLNVTKKEQLERELMAEINNESASRKDKSYMTPNLQGKSKIVNKLNHAAYGGGNSSYMNERNKNNSKNRIQL